VMVHPHWRWLLTVTPAAHRGLVPQASTPGSGRSATLVFTSLSSFGGFFLKHCVEKDPEAMS
jgi:hypothetical protein